MLNSTVITVVGNLTDNPELRFTPAGVPMARFTVAVNPRVFDKTTGEWRDGEASFYNCTAWRQLADNTAQSLSRGIRVIVTGTIAQQRWWETDQNENPAAWVGKQVADAGQRSLGRLRVAAYGHYQSLETPVINDPRSRGDSERGC